MFFELIRRNSRRNRRENGLFFASLLISIIAFYIVLSLSQQDVMQFLRQMESDAVNRLLAMIPLFYGMTLVILFFLIYFASKFQLERRRHEFGMYLMLGMRRGRLFWLLLAEDLSSSVIALVIGLPAAVLLSELISLIVARLVGLGIIGHQFSLSLSAVLLTIVGFLAIKLAAFLILSAKISRQEIGSLLAEVPEGSKKQRPAVVYGLALLAGICCLGSAYYLAIQGMSWRKVSIMGLTILLGFAGTLLLFYGLRSVFGLILKGEKRDRRLHRFNVRQIQESVVCQSKTMAVSSILILAALCCFGAGVAVAAFYGKSESHVLDYTFLQEHSEEEGYIRTTEEYENVLELDGLMEELSELPESDARDTLQNTLSYAEYPHLISLSGYNRLLRLAGLPDLDLEKNEAAIYMDQEFISDHERSTGGQPGNDAGWKPNPLNRKCADGQPCDRPFHYAVFCADPAGRSIFLLHPGKFRRLCGCCSG